MTSTPGFILSLVGGLLDFASGAMVLAEGMHPEMGALAGAYTPLLGILLLVLGAAVVVTGVASIMMIGMMRMRLFRALMMAYGIVMLPVGWAMLNGTMYFYGYGMLAVGALMVVNGLTMRRPSLSMD